MKKAVRCRPAMASLLIVWATTSVSSAASPEETAAARAAAQAGVQSFERGNYAEALDRFERAEGILHAMSHLLYEARCHEKLGNLVRARELYIKLTREPLPADAPQAFVEARKAAEAELPAVEARVPYVTLVVKGEGAKNASVMVDDVTIPKGIIGLPYPVNPGPHQFIAKTTDGRSAAGSATIEEGTRKELELVLSPSSSGATTVSEVNPPAPTVVTTSAESVSSERAWMRPVGYATLGTGVVGVALGTFMTLRGASKHADANELYDRCARTCSDTEMSQIRELDQQARTAGLLTVTGFAVGGIGLASGITLLLLAPKSTEQVALAPFVSPTSVGLVGQF